MFEWGSVADWLNVTFAGISLFILYITQRDKLLSRRSNRNNNLPDGEEDAEAHIPERHIQIRTELYSRILIGIVFGIALSPLFALVSSKLFPAIEEYNYSAQNNAQTLLAVVFAVIMSFLLTFVYYSAYPQWESVFVHFVERLAVSFIGFWIVLAGFSSWDKNPMTDVVSISTYPLENVITSVILFLLIGFSTTPIDWLVSLVAKFRGGNT